MALNFIAGDLDILQWKYQDKSQQGTMFLLQSLPSFLSSSAAFLSFDVQELKLAEIY